MRAATRLVLSVGLFVSFTFCTQALCKAEAAAKWDKAEIIRAWAQQESEFDSVAIEWDENQILSVGDFGQPQKRRRERLGETHRFLIKGNMYRFEQKAVANAGDGEWADQSLITAFDGHVNQSLLPKESLKFAQGSISAGKEFMDLPSIHLRPILMAFRPRCILDLTGDIRVKQELVDVDGIECVEISQIIKLDVQPEFAMSLYCLPEQEFLPIRYEDRQGETLLAQVNVLYSRNYGPYEVPETWWSYISAADGEIREGAAGAVNTVIINEDIADAEFTLKFPVGARLNQGGKQYEIMPDGSRKLLTPEDLKKSLQDRPPL